MDIQRAKTPKRRKYIWGGVGLLAAVGITVALSRLEPAAPTVEGATIWRDTVRRGPMVREVRGPGTLVPEQIRWIPAVTAGRVEAIYVRPGTQVGPGTVLLELSNPDVQLQALEAQRQLTGAEAELVNLRSSLETQRLNQSGVVASTRSQYLEAMRQVKASEELAERGLIAKNELARVKDQAEELSARVEIEKQRLDVMTQSMKSQLAVQQSQLERLRSIVAFRQTQIESMRVVAGDTGVLQDLPLEIGQWANAGMTLARVVQPSKLKAVLRIPETQAKDVTIGQIAAIDTRNGIVPGRVVRQDPASQNGTVTVDVALEGALPRGARPDLSVDGTITIERLDNVLYVGRPAYGQAESTVGLFRLSPDGKEAHRVNVKLGRSSVNTIEVVSGLNPGDVVILSDMSAWDSFDKVRIK